MVAEPAEVSLVCVLFPTCFVPQADYAAAHENGFCIYAHKHQRNARHSRIYMCQNAPFLHPPHAADYIYILDVVAGRSFIFA
jgi:hypothetical protein